MQHFLQLTCLYFKMVLLRAQPYQVPNTYAVFWGSVTASVLSYVVVISSHYGLSESLPRVALDMLVLFALLYGGLKITGHRERFVQGYAALCGTGALLNLAFWPILLSTDGLDAGDTVSTSVSLILLGLYLWSVIVVANIFRHCFGIRMRVGVIVSIAYLITVVMVADYLFPAPILESTAPVSEV